MSITSLPTELLTQILHRLLPGPDDFTLPSTDAEPPAQQVLRPITKFHTRATPHNIFISQSEHTPQSHADILSAMLVCSKWYHTSLRLLYQEVDAQPILYDAAATKKFKRRDLRAIGGAYSVHKDRNACDRLLVSVPILLARTLAEKPHIGPMVKRLVLGNIKISRDGLQPAPSRKAATDINIGIIIACENLEDLKIYRPSQHRRVELREALSKKTNLRSLQSLFRPMIFQDETFTQKMLRTLVANNWPHLEILAVGNVVGMWKDKIRTWRWIKSLWERAPRLTVIDGNNSVMDEHTLVSMMNSEYWGWEEEEKRLVEMPFVEQEELWERSDDDMELEDVEGASIASWSGSDLDFEMSESLNIFESDTPPRGYDDPNWEGPGGIWS